MKKRYWLAILCAILALALTVAAASADTGDDYKKMTDASGLHDGDKVIFVSDDGNNYQAMTTDFSGVQVTVTDNLITEQDGMLPMTLSEADGGWIFAADGGYLAVIEGALTVVPDQADAATWSVSIASNGVATISCATGNLIFAEQDGAYRFFCGESGNEIAIFNSTFEAEQHAFGDGLWWSFSNGKLTIGGSGKMPDSLLSTGQPWVSLRNEITKVEIRDSVTRIGDNAFIECLNLTEVVIPSSVTSIGDYAFSGCSALTEITIPDSLTCVGDYVFNNTGWWNAQSNGLVYLDYVLLGVKYSCGQIIRIEDGTRIIAGSAFASKSQITKVTIPDSVTYIGDNAFSGCSGLTEISIPNGVISIGDSAFYYCTGLSEITIPDSVMTIGSMSFSYCSGLESITLPCSVNGDHSAFYYCSAVTSVRLTKGTGIMPDNWGMFDGLKSNTLTLTLDEGIERIGKYAFNRVSSFQTLTFPDSLTSIGEYAFYGCTELESITFGNGSVSLDRYAFYNCTALTSIAFQGDTNIGEYAFINCTGLSSIAFQGDTNIGEYAFSGCTELESITFGNGAITIDNYAFNGCTGLKSIVFPESITSIGEYAFYNCTGLKSVTLPNSKMNVDGFAFYGCSALTDVYYIGTPTDRDNNLTIEESSNGPLLNATWHYELAFTTQPKSVTVANGKTATFKVVAKGGTVSYQWYYSKDNGTKWTKMSGKTSASLSVKASTTTNGYLYRCVAKNAKYTETSKNAKLTVSGVKPKIVVQPKAATVASGKSNTFKVVAAGSGLKYQWYYSKDNGTKWTKMSGKTSASLKIKGSATTNGYLYRCKITNTKGSVTSKSVKLTVSGVKPKIVVQPTAATVKSGKTAKFTVVAAGTELKYQWYYSKNAGKTWTKMSGKTAATLSVKGSKTNNGYLYRCVVKNTKGSVTSKNAKLTVK